MKSISLIFICAFLITTLELLTNGYPAKRGPLRPIAYETKKHVRNSSDTENNTIAKDVLLLSPTNFTFCGSTVFDKITDVMVKSHMKNCCYYLDGCDDFIAPHQTKYGLHNPHDLKIVTCECDSKFKGCLDESESTLKDPIFEAVQVAYFVEYSRKCLQKLYIHSCNGPWFNEYEDTYDDNLDFYFFCPKLIRSVRAP